MTVRIPLLILALLLLAPPVAWPAPPKPRPLAGIGLLSIPREGVNRGGTGMLLLYREPGVGRITEIELSDFPSMALSIKPTPTLQQVAVTRKKGEWLKVIFDDSGREGWLKNEQGWEFRNWQEYLKGGEVRLLHGLRKELYQLRSAPSPSAQSIATVGKDKRLRVIELEDSWILVLVDYAGSGWLRWKDSDGRLTISTEGEKLSQKH